jgi:hypothetical protein
MAAIFTGAASRTSGSNEKNRLPRTHPEGARLRRGGADTARSGPDSLGAHRQPPVLEAGGPAVGVFLQVARRLQQDGESDPGATLARRDCRIGGQSCAGCGSGRTAAALQGGNRHAGDHAGDQGQCRQGARRAGGVDRGFLFRCLCPREKARFALAHDFCASL